MSKRIFLSQLDQSGFEEQFIQKAFSENWIAAGGQNVSDFEIQLENYLEDNSNVALLSSGTAAIHLGLILLGVKGGDEVICQTMTFSASANPIVYLGATPIFVDSEPETCNICPVALENAIKDRVKLGIKPKAIIAVHLYGMPYKVDEIKRISIQYSIPVLEDSAEALGSTYDGKKCGTFGDISVLSFNGNKIITTSGGGAIISKEIEIKNKAIYLATQSRDKAPHYQHSEIGYNYRMSNVNAGIGIGQMMVLDKHIEARREMHNLYFDFFKNIDGVTVFTEPNNSYFSNHWLTIVFFNPEKYMDKNPEALRLALENDDIESRPLWKPLHLQPVFSKFPYYGNDIAEFIFNKGLCLPSSSNLKIDEKNRIINVLKHFFH
jgi:dTDP-4-amino-4,6-dideoxygalactose transaminase